MAKVIREQIKRVRDPENLHRLVALSNELFSRTIETGRLFWWWPSEGGIGINNMYKGPIRSIHFGYPESMRFYTYDSWEQYFRIWPANPVKLPDGTWQTYEGGADICFRIKNAQWADVMRTLKEDLTKMTSSDGDLRSKL